MKIIFYGSSEVSLEYLKYLYNNEDVAAVVTALPKPAGRGLKPRQSPVEIFAGEKGIKTFTPEKLAVNEIIPAAAPDLGVVVAYGKILPKPVIEYPRLGTVNIHFSLLPKYRGAAPIQRALISGEKITGITIFYLDEGVDTGKIILQEETEISAEDNAVTLRNKLMEQGVVILRKALEMIKGGKVPSVPQEGAPSYAPVLKKSDGRLDWKKSAVEINNLIRGTYPWPGAYTVLETGARQIRLTISGAYTLDVCPGDEKTCPSTALPGDITGFEKGAGFVVKCGKGFLAIKCLKPEGKKEMPAWEFVQGARITREDKFIGT